MKKRVLLVEDDKNIRDILAYNLRAKDYEVLYCEDGEVAVTMVQQGKADIVLMDIMIQGISGFDSLKEIRKFSNIPVLITSALETEEDKLKGFELGADDYITKPFSIKELIARMEVHLKKRISVDIEDNIDIVPDIASSNIVRADNGVEYINFREGITLNKSHHNLDVDGAMRELGVTEYNLLLYLYEHSNQVISREQLLTDVWGYSDGDVQVVDVAIHRLRNKIERNSSKPDIIRTSKGFGYYCCI